VTRRRRSWPSSARLDGFCTPATSSCTGTTRASRPAVEPVPVAQARQTQEHGIAAKGVTGGLRGHYSGTPRRAVVRSWPTREPRAEGLRRRRQRSQPAAGLRAEPGRRPVPVAQ
jgi:hypothetical protein